jgi:hypothetical protein
MNLLEEWKGARSKHIALGTVSFRPTGWLVLGIATVTEVPEIPCAWVVQNTRPVPNVTSAVAKAVSDIRCGVAHSVLPTHADYAEVMRAAMDLVNACAAAPDRFRTAILQIVQPATKVTRTRPIATVSIVSSPAWRVVSRSSVFPMCARDQKAMLNTGFDCSCLFPSSRYSVLIEYGRCNG